MSALEDRLDEASAVATQPELELAAALVEGCAVVEDEGEEPSERHAGPCAVRYNKDTQFDTSANSSFTAPHFWHRSIYYERLQWHDLSRIACAAWYLQRFG